MLRNGQNEPDGVRGYSERIILFVAKRNINPEKSKK